MRTELNRYQVAFTETAAENRQLKKKNKTLSASLDKAKGRERLEASGGCQSCGRTTKPP